MKASELIEELKKYPPDTEVWHNEDGEYCGVMEVVEHPHFGPRGCFDGIWVDLEPRPVLMIG